MISVIIPTYKEPEALELCLKSCINNQINKNEIIVIVDGTYEINKEVLKQFKEIDIFILDENKGLPYATNFGVDKAQGEFVLIVNDDNVFSKEWDVRLLKFSKYVKSNWVVSPNQIEPYPSMFKDFTIKDLGKNIKEFKYEEFIKFTEKINKETSNLSGSTLPIFMSKSNFKLVEGWDEKYPTNGIVADWDFFLKCSLKNLKFMRIFNTHFYHFVSLSVPTEEQKSQRRKIEQEAHEYARRKWGEYIKHNPINNLKFL